MEDNVWHFVNKANHKKHTDCHGTSPNPILPKLHTAMSSETATTNLRQHQSIPSTMPILSNMPTQTPSKTTTTSPRRHKPITTTKPILSNLPTPTPSTTTTTSPRRRQPITTTKPSQPNANRKHSKKGSIKMAIVNCRSIKGKSSLLTAFIETEEPDILIGNESWLDPSICSAEIFPHHLQVFRRDRNSHGGGVFIAINK